MARPYRANLSAGFCESISFSIVTRSMMVTLFSFYFRTLACKSIRGGPKLAFAEAGSLRSDLLRKYPNCLAVQWPCRWSGAHGLSIFHAYGTIRRDWLATSHTFAFG